MNTMKSWLSDEGIRDVIHDGGQPAIQEQFSLILFFLTFFCDTILNGKVYLIYITLAIKENLGIFLCRL